jgi:hypothetical protein
VAEAAGMKIEAAGMKIEGRLGCRFAAVGWHRPFPADSA